MVKKSLIKPQKNQQRVVWWAKKRQSVLRRATIEPGLYEREELVGLLTLQGFKDVNAKIGKGQMPCNWVMVNSFVIKIFPAK